jgi:hypothetical protein
MNPRLNPNPYTSVLQPSRAQPAAVMNPRLNPNPDASPPPTSVLQPSRAQPAAVVNPRLNTNPCTSVLQPSRSQPAGPERCAGVLCSAALARLGVQLRVGQLASTLNPKLALRCMVCSCVRVSLLQQ